MEHVQDVRRLRAPPPARHPAVPARTGIRAVPGPAPPRPAVAGPRRVAHAVVQRTPELERAREQAAMSQLRAWGLRGIQLLIAFLGMKGLLSGPLAMPIGADKSGLPIRAHLVPGQVDDVALVVAGVHGSEQSGVEVAERLLAQLAVHRPYLTVVVVPRLFPDNVAGREAWEKKLAADQGTIALRTYRRLRNDAGDPHRSSAGEVDPNRQLPELGTDLDLAKPVDSKGRVIEPGNLALLALVEAFSPSRILSIHAHKTLTSAGVFADPHPSTGAGALAAESDALAIATAKHAQAGGARVGGNTSGKGWSSLYPGQNPKTAAKQMAKENKAGRTLGQWGPSRGIGVITVEVAEQYRSDSAVKDPTRGAELEAHASAIREVFLGPPPTAASAPASAGAVPAQRLVVARIAAAAGNHASTAAVQRLRSAGATVPAHATQPPGHAPTLQRGWWEDIAGAVGSAADVVTSLAGGAAKVAGGAVGGVGDLAHDMSFEQAMVKRLVMSGVTDPDALTQMVYAWRHPESGTRALDPAKAADKPLIREWLQIKTDVVVPWIARYQERPGLTPEDAERRARRAATQAEKGGAAAARAPIARDIRTHAGKSVSEWFAEHVAGATFLGLPIRPSNGSAVGGVHRSMLERLNNAAAELAALPELRGRTGVELADALGVDGIGGLRPPKAATGGTSPSAHCYGLAVDINYTGNPFIGNNGDAVPAMIRRATLLMRGTAFEITAPPPKERGVMEQWRLTNNASDDVVTYLNMDAPTLEFQIGEMLAMNGDVPARMRSLSWWLARQREDRATKGKGDLVRRDARIHGILDLDERLVRALTNAGLTWGGTYRGDRDLMHFDDQNLIPRG